MYFKIIKYNHEGVELGRKIRTVGLFIVPCLIIMAYVTDNYNVPNVMQFIVKYCSFIMLILVVFGSLKVGYHTNKLEKVGQMKVEFDETFISDNSGELIIRNSDYDISFSDSGYEGRSRWNPVTGIGAMIKDSGINVIIFKKEEKILEYEILISNFRQLDALKNLLKEIQVKRNEAKNA
jgi:hypothetical protein